SNYHQALMHVQDITGGLLVTGPGEEDLNSEETAKYINRYLGGAKDVPARERLQTINLISDLTTGDFGGYQATLAIHAEGSLEAEWDEIMRVNLKGVFLCCQAAGRVMIPQKSGCIINVSSIGGQVALPKLLAYTTAKGAVNQLTRALAVEWAPYGIRVNAIAP